MPNQIDSSKSIQVSSNFTLFFKLAFPIFWTVFFAGFTFSAFNTPMNEAFHMPLATFQFYTVLFFVGGILFLFFTFWQLKRVEFFPDSFYATNYFKHYRYGYNMIESISGFTVFPFRVMVIKLTQKGHLGRKLPFIISRKRWALFKETYPELAKELGILS